ncbi:hypothetical protein TNCV_1288441 [Trichonephila clavipes]|nr:hypothetical protein TNCV_1288441 [Trichonephila clavipes]
MFTLELHLFGCRGNDIITGCQTGPTPIVPPFSPERVEEKDLCLKPPRLHGRKCRQNTGTNPLCTRLHGDPAKIPGRNTGPFFIPFSTRNFGGKRRVFSNSPMMHCARDSFIQDGCCFGLLALDNRINNNPHKHLGRPKRIGYNCPGFGVYTSAHFQ